MKAGEVRLRWDAFGELDIKVSLPLDGEVKKLVVNVLLDAAKAINNAGSPLVLPEGPGAKIYAG